MRRAAGNGLTATALMVSAGLLGPAGYIPGRYGQSDARLGPRLTNHRRHWRAGSLLSPRVGPRHAWLSGKGPAGSRPVVLPTATARAAFAPPTLRGPSAVFQLPGCSTSCARYSAAPSPSLA